VVPNASNREVVAEELTSRMAGRQAVLHDDTLATSLLAIQGPAAAGILQPLTGLDLGSLRRYAAARTMVAGLDALVARTGYTGEDGFELFVAWDDGPAAWDALLAAGAGGGLLPCGLGARDTLRLEAGMPLYGNELDRGRLWRPAWPFCLDRPGDFVGGRPRAREGRRAAAGDGDAAADVTATFRRLRPNHRIITRSQSPTLGGEATRWPRSRSARVRPRPAERSRFARPA
jgi:aminomethyltransferase